jgi:PleD family two-component response regulator
MIPVVNVPVSDGDVLLTTGVVALTFQFAALLLRNTIDAEMRVGKTASDAGGRTVYAVSRVAGSEDLRSEHVPVVLVVENDVLERAFNAATLRRQGLEVLEAADMAEALRVLKKIAVDILISDVSLIDGMARAIG